MKKLLFLLMCVLGMHTAHAQLTDIWIDSNVTLTNQQWHYEGVSILGTTTNLYLVITPERYFYRTLLPIPPVNNVKIRDDVIRNYRPYYYNGRLGWFLEGRLHYYFYANGVYTILHFMPILRDLLLGYNLYHARHLDLRHWRFYDRQPVYQRGLHNYLRERPYFETHRRSAPLQRYSRRSAEPRSLDRFKASENHPPQKTQARPAPSQRTYRSGTGKSSGSSGLRSSSKQSSSRKR